MEGSRSRYQTEGAIAKAAGEILAKLGAQRWVGYQITSEENYKKDLGTIGLITQTPIIQGLGFTVYCDF